MFTAHDFLWSMLIPAGVALLLSLAGAFLKHRAWLAPLALGLGFFIAFPALNYDTWHIPKFPPAEACEWLPIIALLATIIGIVDALWRMPQWLRYLLVLAFSAIGVRLLLNFKFKSSWTPTQGWEIVTGFALMTAIWWGALEDCEANGPIVTPLALWLIGSCAAVSLMATQCLILGKLCFPLAACVFAILPAVLWRRSSGALRGLSVVFAMLAVAILVGSFFVAGLEPTYVILVGVAPLFLFAGRFTPAGWKPWQRGIVRLIVMMLPLGVAVGLALRQAKQDASQQDQEETMVVPQSGLSAGS